MKAPLFTFGAALLGAATFALQEPSPAPAPSPAPLAEGDIAPQFTLNDQNGKLVSLAGDAKGGFEGWTLVAFYPKALTGG